MGKEQKRKEEQAVMFNSDDCTVCTVLHSMLHYKLSHDALHALQSFVTTSISASGAKVYWKDFIH